MTRGCDVGGLFKRTSGGKALGFRQRAQAGVLAAGLVVLCGCAGSANVDKRFHVCGRSDGKAQTFRARRTSGDGVRFGGVCAGARRNVQGAERRARRRRRRRRMDDAVARTVGFAADAVGVAVAPEDATFVYHNHALSVVEPPESVPNVLDAVAVGAFALDVVCVKGDALRLGPVAALRLVGRVGFGHRGVDAGGVQSVPQVINRWRRRRRRRGRRRRRRVTLDALLIGKNWRLQLLHCAVEYDGAAARSEKGVTGVGARVVGVAALAGPLAHKGRRGHSGRVAERRHRRAASLLVETHIVCAVVVLGNGRRRRGRRLAHAVADVRRAQRRVLEDVIGPEHVAGRHDLVFHYDQRRVCRSEHAQSEELQRRVKLAVKVVLVGHDRVAVLACDVVVRVEEASAFGFVHRLQERLLGILASGRRVAVLLGLVGGGGGGGGGGLGGGGDGGGIGHACSSGHP